MARVDAPASSSGGRQPSSAEGSGTENPTFAPNGTGDEWKKRKEDETNRLPAANGDLEAPKPAANENSADAEDLDLFESRKVQKLPAPTLIAPRKKNNDDKNNENKKDAPSGIEKSKKSDEAKAEPKSKSAVKSKSEEDKGTSKTKAAIKKPVKSEKPPEALKEADQQNTWRSAPVRSRLVLHARYRSPRGVRRTAGVNRGWTPVRATARLVSK